ncbi:MAG: PP2C family serine/threonine-protein phosphatase [Chloroflexota bacterium]
MNFFKRLFRKRPAAEPDSAKTAPLDPETLGKEILGEKRKYITVGSAQSKGIERTHNEDALLVLLGTSGGQEAMPDFGLFVVADGMGGHRSGEMASSISARTVAKRITEQTLLGMLDIERDEGSAVPIQELVRLALEDANHAVVERVPGGGTTLTVALLVGEQVTFGHVGDTRAYILSDSQIRVVTRDHSLVERLRELGQLTRQEAANHPQRNVLYRAIGQGANLEVDVFTHPAPAGGYLLVCSDGLWGVLPDEDIARIIHSASSPQAACEQLVQAANAAGGPDNITAVLVHFPTD